MKGGDNIQAVGVLICQTNLLHDKHEMSYAQLTINPTLYGLRDVRLFMMGGAFEGLFIE